MFWCCFLSGIFQSAPSPQLPQHLSPTGPKITAAPSNPHRHRSGQRIVIGVKTTVRHHQSRLPFVLNTWYGLSPSDIFFITDDNDSELQKRLGKQFVVSQCGKTHAAVDLAWKTGHVLQVLTDAVLSSDETSWMCVVDDDVFVNWAVLRPLLLEELSSDMSQSNARPIYLGRRSVKEKYPLPVNYSKFFAVDQSRRTYWFATGGAGVCLNRAAAIKLRSFLLVLAQVQPAAEMGVGHGFAWLCRHFGLPDDVCLGLVMKLQLGIDMEEWRNMEDMEELHSHREKLGEMEKPLEQATMSYSKRNVVNP